MATAVRTLPYVRSAEMAAGDAYADSILVCMVLIAMPVKNAAYFVPPVFIALQALSGNTAIVGRILLWGSLAVCLSTLAIVIDSLGGQDVNPQGLLIGVITYAPLAVILGLRSDFTISPTAVRRLRTAVAWFVIIQSMIGFVQFAASGNPDTVCGTFGLLDFLGGVTIAQVYLTFNLFSMLMFLLTDVRGKLSKVAIIVGFVACALAHSGHQTIFFMGSLAFVSALQMRFRDIVRLGAVLTVLIALTCTISTITSHDIFEWYRKVTEEEDSPKRMIAMSAAQIISSPKNLMLGTGLGQFGSRAALISSGEYLSTDLPRWLTGQSEYFRDCIVPARYEFLDHGESSAMSAPYCSMLNLIVELGVPLSALLLLVVARQFYLNRQLARSTDAYTRSVGMWANVGLVFLVLCCCIENYIEFPQAIFVPSLIYVAAKASTRTEN